MIRTMLVDDEQAARERAAADAGLIPAWRSWVKPPTREALQKVRSCIRPAPPGHSNARLQRPRSGACLPPLAPRSFSCTAFDQYAWMPSRCMPSTTCSSRSTGCAGALDRAGPPRRLAGGRSCGRARLALAARQEHRLLGPLRRWVRVIPQQEAVCFLSDGGLTKCVLASAPTVRSHLNDSRTASTRLLLPRQPGAIVNLIA